MPLPFHGLVPTLPVDDRLSSLPFSWIADDGSLTALSGQVGTRVCSTAAGTSVDAAGGLWHAALGQARWDVVLDAQTGRQRLGLVVEQARSNLLLHSEDLSNAAWTNVSTPTVTVGNLAVGEVLLNLLTDAGSGLLQGKSQIATFSGNGIKAVTILWAPGTSTSTVIRLRDTTAPAERLLVAITASGGVPTPNVTTGTYLGKRQLANGAWELRFLTTSVTAANSHTFFLYPATDVAFSTGGTGNVNLVPAVFNTGPGSYIKNGGSLTSVAAEQVSWPFQLPRRRVWLYLAFTELGGYAGPSLGGIGYAAVGDVTGTGLGVYPNSGNNYAAFHYVGGAGTNVAVGHALPFGKLIELFVTMDTTGKLTLTCAQDGVAQGSAIAPGSPSDMTTGWTNALIRLGAFGSAAGHVAGGVAYHALKVGEYGLGTPTLAKARGYR